MFDQLKHLLGDRTEVNMNRAKHMKIGLIIMSVLAVLSYVLS